MTESDVVRVYSVPGCPGCDLTTAQLEKAGVPFEKIDLSTRPDLIEQFHAEGLRSAPIIEKDGTRTAGFRPDRIKSIIKATKNASITTTPSTSTTTPPHAMSRMQGRGITQ